ncbi:MAG: molybdopterin molybdotransferase MoeA [Candidatus Eremiobacteraeota bacterium]|nr:molybdopterin molybdotransferase MoeA [Candidatus Eremiobacteraeota bacterium]
MQSANPVLPARAFVPEALLPPRQAIVAYFSRVTVAPPRVERVELDDALGRVLAEPIVADDDYPNAPRSLMDGFALCARDAPGALRIAGEVRMGATDAPAATASAVRIPTGGVLPHDADAVVPFEDVRVQDGVIIIEVAVKPGDNVAPRGADMPRGETVLTARRRIRAPEIGVLATLGITAVPVYRRPLVAVISSGDELVEPGARPAAGQIRDSNRYAIAASLRAMGADAHHYPTLRDETKEFESALRDAIRECDAVVVSGGSSVGDRDRLPQAVAAIARPGVVIHGLRVKPGKPTLFGAHDGKPILGLPGNPTSALMMLEAVAAPIVAALVGSPVEATVVSAHLAEPARSRRGWTWYVPVRLQDDAGGPLAHPLPLRSFSVSVTARADGYVVMNEDDEQLAAGTPVVVHRFLGG